MSQSDIPVSNETPIGAPQDQAHPSAEEAARLGEIQRLTGTLFSPGETFEDVNRKPTWIAPLLIVMVTALASTLFFQFYVKPDWDKVMRAQIKQRVERSGQSVNEEQIEQQVAFAKTIAKFSPLLAVVFTPVICVILAGVFALGLMLIQAKTTFKKILSVVAWSYAATGIVAALVMCGALLVRDEQGLRDIDPTDPSTIVPSSPAAFIDASTTGPIKAFASSIDVFTIWFLILLAIGFAAIAGSKKITTGKAATVVFGFWAVWILIRVALAAVFG